MDSALPKASLPVSLVERRDIGEGAADVGGEPEIGAGLCVAFCPGSGHLGSSGCGALHAFWSLIPNVRPCSACASEDQAALTPCRLWEESLTVKKTTSASGVALPECTTFEGM